MIRVARKAFADADVTISPSRISRLVRRCLDRAKRYNVPFRDSLAEAANLSSAQRRRVFADPELARCIAYCDPVGEAAVNNVLRERRRARARAVLRA
jgi:hypothetical protein